MDRIPGVNRLKVSSQDTIKRIRELPDNGYAEVVIRGVDNHNYLVILPKDALIEAKKGEVIAIRSQATGEIVFQGRVLEINSEKEIRRGSFGFGQIDSLTSAKIHALGSASSAAFTWMNRKNLMAVIGGGLSMWLNAVASIYFMNDHYSNSNRADLSELQKLTYAKEPLSPLNALKKP